MSEVSGNPTTGRTTDLFVLFLDHENGVEFRMGGEFDYNAKRRAFAYRKPAISYARKHGAKVAHIEFPPRGIPVVVGVIDPSEVPA
ncbi:hypothetical protein ACQR3W_21700 [Rhodococcus ruber]|uniref:Uncharacterized protein n=1 Tax=Rhodococcus ruber TaxID=1830 RepID=A0A098BJP2_9NOCA|nr:hypothetical protein [Rhodococcus ruber]MCZ4533370.1 hypothetical protein [Rhodococcus ruber]MCZ4533379.1 hypothetical protein [Rhodococcus ruber]CDZ88969.1 hypothetical protein RHRU231_450136 [Rhodococcus ruber]